MGLQNASHDIKTNNRLYFFVSPHGKKPLTLKPGAQKVFQREQAYNKHRYIMYAIAVGSKLTHH
jgi:hypothetical protein